MVSPTATMSSEYDCPRLQGQEGSLFWSTFKLWFWKRQAHLVKNRLQCRRPVWFLGREDPLPTPVFLGFPCGSVGEESTRNAGDWVRSLGWEDPLEKEMAPHSSVLAWRIWWMEEPGGLQSMGLQRVGHDWATSLSRQDEMLLNCKLHKVH